MKVGLVRPVQYVQKERTHDMMGGLVGSGLVFAGLQRRGMKSVGNLVLGSA